MSRREVNRTDKRGTRLVATSEAHEWLGPRYIGLRATLLGFGRDSDHIRILVDGRKTPQSYHRAFWRRAQTFKEKEPL